MMMSYSYGTDGNMEEESQKYITDEVVEELKGLKHVKSANPVLNVSALALKGRYIGYLDLYGMTPEELEARNIELEPGGRLPDPDSAELELVFGNAVLTNFYEESTGRGYWETGEMPDIDLKTDQLFSFSTRMHIIRLRSRYPRDRQKAGMDPAPRFLHPRLRKSM